MRQAKKVESLDDAEKRVLETKLDEAERVIVQRVFAMWRDGRLPAPTARVSKKGVFEAWEAWLKIEHERKVAKVLASRKPNCWIVMDHVTLASLEAALMYEDVVSLDVESTGLDIWNDRIVGVAGYFPASDIEFYVPYGHIDPSDKEAFVEHGKAHGFDAAIEKYRLPSQLPKSDVLAFYAKALVKRHVWHNFDYDAHLTMNEGIDPSPPWWDTMKAMKLLNAHEANYRLKDLHAKYISKGESITFEDLFPDQTIFDKDLTLAGIYAAGDGRKTHELYEFQRKYVDTRDRLRIVWNEIERPLLYIDPMTERNGIPVDLDWLAALKDDLTPKLADAEAKVRAAFGLADDFNFNSPAQLASLIYDQVGVDPTFPRRFKKPDRSTASEVLDAICEDEPKLEPLLEYRMLAKLLGTYIEAIPKSIEPATGRMHFSLKSDGTDTGRYSSSEYCAAKHSRTGDHKKGMNAQNVPAKTKEGKRVRMAFVPSPGFVFVSADLSAIEPRILAHLLYTLYGDGTLRQMFIDGKDPYVELAMTAWNFPRESCVDGAYSPDGSFQPRKAMKIILLAKMYKMHWKSAARKLGVSEDEAKRFFERVDEIMPGLTKFYADTDEALRTVGNIAHIETSSGRKRRFPDYRRDYAELKRLDQDGWKKHTRLKKLSAAALAGALNDEEQREFADLRAWSDKRRDLYFKCSTVERQACNARIQSEAADLLKRCLIRMFAFCRERGWRFLMSVHDELFMEAPASDVTPETVAMVNEIMTKTVELSLPIKTDIVVSPRWMDEYKPDEWFAMTKGA